MNKKTLLQVFMIVIIILICSSIYLKYFKKKPNNLTKKSIVEKVEVTLNSSSNYINEINYTSFDAKGNEYQIIAEQAEIDKDNEDTMFLENIIAYIVIKDSDTIKITSDFGKYNSKNYDTIFSQNVIVIYPEHKIIGEYLDFSFLSNLGTISTNVIYFGNKTKLFADRVEINLITKDTKIFMNDNTKKVLIKGTK
jgi:LPS export ABC transporter protein LptC